MMGRLATTIETNVSRQAHLLPETAPSGPDYGRFVRYGNNRGKSRERVGRTVIMVTARIIAAMITKEAPLNKAIRVIFLLIPMLTVHNN